MAIPVQEPTVTVEKGSGGSDVERSKHPAFAQIRASRVQGHTHLYDSDFSHRHFINVSICRSTKYRDLSRDWHFGGEELIEIAMSEVQWATFVSSLNFGSGVPCTMERFNGEMVPRLPTPPDPSHKFKEEIARTLADIRADLMALAGSLDGPLAKTKVTELRKNLERAAHRLTGSTGFVSDQFDEHVEGTLEKAKCEINAYALSLVARTGIAALKGAEAPVLTYDPSQGV